MNRPPSLFISHGSPMILLDDCPARRFMSNFDATPAGDRTRALTDDFWDVIMVSFNMMHQGAIARVLPAARRRTWAR